MILYNHITNLYSKFKSHKLAKNALFNSSSFVFISFISLIITPFIVRNLTIEGYGIYILLTSIFGFYGIFDLGLGQGLIKFVSEYQATQDLKKLNDAVNSIFWTQFFVGASLSVVLILFASSLVNLFNVSPANFYNAVISLKICAIGFFFSMLSSTFSSVIIGLQRFDITSITESTINLMLNISILVISFLGYGLIGVVAITVVSSFISFITYYFIVTAKLPRYRIYFQIDFSILKQFLEFSRNIFLSKISNIFANYIVRFVVSFFLGPSAVTYYVIPSKLLGAYGGVMGSAVNTLFPYTSSLAATGNIDEIRKVFLKASKVFVAILLPLSLFITLFSKAILMSWIGIEFAEKSWMVLSILCISSSIGAISTIPNLVILGMGNSKLIGIFSIITVISYSLFLPLFTMHFGLVGASSALLLTSVIVISYVIKKTNLFIGIPFSDYWDHVFSIHVFPFSLYLTLSLMMIFFTNNNNIYILFFGGILTLFYFYYTYSKTMLRKN